MPRTSTGTTPYFPAILCNLTFYRDKDILVQVGLLISAVIYDHDGNKAIFAMEGAIITLLDSFLLHCHEKIREGGCRLSVIASVSNALSSLLLFKPNHELFYGRRHFIFCSIPTKL